MAVEREEIFLPVDLVENSPGVGLDIGKENISTSDNSSCRTHFAVNNPFSSGQTIAKIAFRPKGGITAEEVKEINLRVSFFL